MLYTATHKREEKARKGGGGLPKSQVVGCDLEEKNDIHRFRLCISRLMGENTRKGQLETPGPSPSNFTNP